MSDEGLARLRRWARLFDSAFRIPGTQISFGIDPILGLIPGIGDLASPGAIPVLGDAFDFAWKANDWNLSLLERHAIPGGRARGGDWLFVIGCMLVLIAAALVPLVIVWSLFYWIGRSMSSL